MGDNERSRRRAGDETRARIDDLAGGGDETVIPTGEPTGRDVPRLDPASLRATTAADEDVVTLENEAIDTAPAVAALAERDDATVVDARSTTIGVGGPAGAASMAGAPDPRRPEATRAARPATRLGGTTSAVRALASLPRTGGLAGDLRYVATVTFGVCLLYTSDAADEL